MLNMVQIESLESEQKPVHEVKDEKDEKDEDEGLKDPASEPAPKLDPVSHGAEPVTEPAVGSEPRPDVVPTADTTVLGSAELKLQGNTYFKQAEYQLAIDVYEKALASTPITDKPLLSAIYANIGAAYLKLNKYKESVDASTKCLELDEKYAKARLRRSEANEKIDTWASLESSLEDLTVLKSDTTLSAELHQQIGHRMKGLPAKIQEKQESETGEMINKAKDLGNGLLKNFGLSLDNFKFEKNAEGGYNLKMT